MKNSFWRRLIFGLLMFLLLAGTPIGDQVLNSAGITGVIMAEAAAKPKISKKSTSLVIGGKTTVQLKNTNSKKAVTWQSQNEQIVTIKTSGANGSKVSIVAKKAGTTYVTGIYDSRTYKVKVTVKKPVLSKKTLTVNAGKTASITLKNISSTQKVTWKSSDTSIVTVKAKKNKVTISGKKGGTATITASCNGEKYTCKITVKAKKVKVKWVELNNDFTRIDTNRTFQLVATIHPSNATNQAVTWKSSNTKIATVSKNGLVTPKKSGTVKITCTTKDGNKKAVCKVAIDKVPTSKYSYQFSILNPENYALHNEYKAVVYVKTDNPTAANLTIKNNGKGVMKYAVACDKDINYISKTSDGGFLKVAGGYVTRIDLDKTGTQTYVLYEKISGKYVEVASTTVEIQDFYVSLKKWSKEVAKKIFTSSMTEKEKVLAFSQYIYDNSMYNTADGKTYADLYKYTGAPWEVMKKKKYAMLDCISANCLLGYMVQYTLGLEGTLEYAGYLNHHYLKVQFTDGTTGSYDATPPKRLSSVDTSYIL